MAKKGKVLQTIIDISGEISPTLGKTIDSVVDRISEIDVASAAADAAIAAIGAGAAVGIKKATDYMAQLGDGYNTAIGDLSAQTGAVNQELDLLADSVQAIYGQNLGESLGDVADSLAEVKRQTGLFGDDLESVTADALMLRDTFEYDVNESTRAAAALMKNFGIDGHEAMNLIASGAQNGLDFSGEMLDTISEYSVQFAKVGLDADDMFNIMQAGADGTAWTLDKVGDTVKEFAIRAIDGSKSTVEGFEAIGMNADEMMQIFAKGGDAASDAFYDVLNGLLSIEDPVARDAAGVQLMGTMWEDMGVDAIRALAGTEGGAYATTGALTQINDVKYNNLGDAMEGIRRKIDVGLIPASSALTQSLVDVAPQIGTMVEQASPYLESLAEKIGPIVSSTVSFAVNGLGLLADNIDVILPILGGLTGALVTYKAVTTAVTIAEGIKTAVLASGATTVSAATVATWALNGALTVLTSPVFLVVAAIAALIAAGVALYRNWDTVKQYASNLGNFLLNTWTRIKTGVINLKDGIVEAFKTGFQSLVGIVKAPVNAIIGIVNGAIDGINGMGFSIPSWVPFIGGKAFRLNIPHMRYLAKGGFTDGVSIAGEAGTEAVISFDRRYREDNLSYWAKAGRMLGATTADMDLGLSAPASATVDVGGITFAPQITISGNADKRSIIDAIRDEYPEFLDMLDEYFAERGVPVYG